MNSENPLEGDEVRARGSDVLMTVASNYLGPDGVFDGIQNAVLCIWTDETGDREEIYTPDSLIVVRRAGEAASDST